MTSAATRFQSALIEALDDLGDGVAGTIAEDELVTRVGASSIVHLVEASDLDGADQQFAYSELCDLLASRLESGFDEVMGCIVFAATVDPRSFAATLTGMRHGDAFTPVIPLGSDQARQLSSPHADTDAFADAATALIGVAASHASPTEVHAATLLDELDELVRRHCPPTTKA